MREKRREEREEKRKEIPQTEKKREQKEKESPPPPREIDSPKPPPRTKEKERRCNKPNETKTPTISRRPKRGREQGTRRRGTHGRSKRRVQGKERRRAHCKKKSVQQLLFSGLSAKLLTLSHFTRAPPWPSLPLHRARKQRKTKTAAMACGRRALIVAAAVVCASAVLGGGRHASVAAAAPSLHSGRSLAASAAAPASSITSADVEKTTLALLEAAELQAAVSDSMVTREGGKKRARERAN